MSVEEIRLKATSIPEKGFSFGAPASTSSGFGSAAGISISLGGPAGTSSSSSGNSASTRTSEMEKNDSEKEKESMHDEKMEKEVPPKVEDDCHFSSKWFQKSRDAFTLNAFGGVTRSFDTREALLQKARNAPPVMLKKYDGYIDRTIHAFEDEFEKCIINLRKRLMLTDNCDAEERLGLLLEQFCHCKPILPDDDAENKEHFQLYGPTSRMKIAVEEMSDWFVEQFIRCVPPPSRILNIQKGVSVGSEAAWVGKRRAELKAEIAKIERARDGLNKAFEIINATFKANDAKSNSKNEAEGGGGIFGDAFKFDSGSSVPTFFGSVGASAKGTAASSAPEAATSTEGFGTEPAFSEDASATAFGGATTSTFGGDGGGSRGEFGTSTSFTFGESVFKGFGTPQKK